MKKRLFTLLLVSSLILTGCGKETSATNESAESEEIVETQEEAIPKETENDENLSEETEPDETLPEKSSDPSEAEDAEEDPFGFNIMFSDTYRNDVTGNWRLARIAEDINIEEYALEYYKNYFKSDDEIHIIINFTLNTTTSIRVMGNLLDITTMEYVDKEEHDAKLACSGALLAEYHIDMETGEIEQIQ